MLSIIESLKNYLTRDLLEASCARQAQLLGALQTNSLLTGKMLSNQLKTQPDLDNIQDAEFKVFSQWGDDGIIQYLVQRLDIPVKNFIEFGVSNYAESNTRFLLLNNNWSGLVMDCSAANVSCIVNDETYWMHDLTAKAAFVTAENVNATLSQSGFRGETGLLHIDVDGNDYWIWKAVETVAPVIVIVEYNSLFGIDRAITVPYDPQFDRFAAHHSGLFAGTSLLALCDLAHSKGYTFVGSNSAGNNAYFVRNDQAGRVKSLTPQQGYVASRFREHRDAEGRLTFLAGSEAIKTVRGMKVFNTRTQSIEDL